MTWTVDWRVTIDGRDVSTFMRPYLLDISVSDKAGLVSDACNLSFDDMFGQLLLPKNGAKVAVYLNGVSVFQGVVDGTPWTLSRGGGRVLSVNAKGIDLRGKAKEAQLWHLDDGKLEDALRKAGEKAGFSDVIIDPDFASIERAYWSPDGMSFMAWGQKLARELGGTFKIRDDKAVLAKRGGGESATGSAMPTITGRVGDNVISASIDPAKGRARYSKARVRYFDRKKAEFRTKDVEIEGEGVDVEDGIRGATAADEDSAERMAKGRKADAERDAGVGSVEIDLAPVARAEGTFILTGARPGIDGTYRITGVTHKADRNGGSTTSLDLAQPSGDAGKDSRIPVPTPAPR